MKLFRKFYWITDENGRTKGMLQKNKNFVYPIPKNYYFYKGIDGELIFFNNLKSARKFYKVKKWKLE